MKKNVIALLILIFGMCGTLGFFSLRKNDIAEAASVSASVWDGNYYGLDNLTEDDITSQSVNGQTTYYIRSAKGFSYLPYAVNGNAGRSMSFQGIKFVLETDIDLAGMSWTPIGESTQFKGSFDGNGHYIHNLKISNVSNNIGLFGNVFGEGSETAIKNLHLRNVDIDITNTASQMNVGVLVGTLSGLNATAYVQNCSTGGNISISGLTSTKSLNIGGVVGYALNAKLGSVDNANEIVGIRSFVNINLNGENSDPANLNVGGLVGQMGSTALYNSASESVVNLNKLSVVAGGLVGYINSTSDNIIKNAYNIGQIHDVGDNSILGGILGKVDSFSTDSPYDGVSCFEISNVYNAGIFDNGDDSVTANGLIGNIIAPNSEYSILQSAMQLSETENLDYVFTSNLNSIGAKDLYYSAESSSLNANNIGALTNLSEIAKSREFYQNIYTTNENGDFIGGDWTEAWDFENVWQISSSINGGLPYIFIDGATNNDIETGSDIEPDDEIKLERLGTKSSPYLIKTAGDLAWLSNNWNSFNQRSCYFSLQNNIDLTGRTWVPIAYNTDEYFSGVFDGNGHTISGMTCSLYQQFEYHALFAKTKNAVIKNLQVEDVRFVNDGTIDNSTIKKAALVGLAGSETYIINCADKTGDTALNTIASVDGANILYGANNNFDTINMKLTGLSELNYSIGYDIEIDGNGGIFFDKDGNVYQNYHVLVDEDFGRIEQEIDSTFAKNILPSTSESEAAETSDVLTRKGYKLTSFVCDDGSEIALDSMLLTTAAKKGLTASWASAVVTIAIDYNDYEAANFENCADYIEEFSVNYDAYLSDCLNLFTKYNSLDNSLRPGFKVAGIYQDNTFKDVIWTEDDGFVGENSRLNSNFLGEDGKITFYAKWEGDENYSFNLQINLGKTSEKFYNDFELADAVESVKLIKNWKEILKDDSGNLVLDSSNKVQYVSKSEIILGVLTDASDGGINVSFDIFTNISADAESFYQLQINLKDGYVLTSNVSLNNDASGSGDNFGKYVENDSNRRYFGDLECSAIAPNYGALESDSSYVLNKSNPYTIFNFNNLVGDYSLSLTIKRAEFLKALNVGNGIFYGIAPVVENYTEVAFAYGGDTTYQISDLSGYYSSGDELIAYNFLTGGVLSNAEGYDYKLLDQDSIVDGVQGRVAFKYTLPNAKNLYYFYELSIEGELYYITLYQAEETQDIISPNQLQAAKQVVRLIGEYADSKYGDISHLSYLSHSSFATIFSTEDSSVKISDYAPINSNDDGYTLEKLVATETSTHKLLMKFDQFVDFPYLAGDKVHGQAEFSDKIDVDHRKPIKVVGEYHEAVFEFQYYTRDESGNLVELNQNAPIAVSEKRCSINEDGILLFSVVPSNYYKFDGESVVFADEADNFNIRISVDEKTLIKLVASTDYKSHFDENNSNYFGVDDSSVNKLEGGEIEISLAYKQATTNVDYKSLQAGKYLVQVVCENVLYSLDVNAKILKQGSETEFDDDEESHGIISAASKTTDILYNDEITLSTSLDKQKQAYVFYGWFLQQNSTNGKGDYLRDSNGNIVKETSLSRAYNLLNNQEGQTGENRFNISIYAVYQRKQVLLNFSDRVDIRYALADNSGIQDETTLSFWKNPHDALGVEISMLKDAVGTNSFEYVYDGESSGFDLCFSLSGTNAAAYDIYGLALVDYSNQFIEDASGNPIVLWTTPKSEEQEDGDVVNAYLQDFDQLYDKIKAKIESGQTALEEVYYIAPILKKKQISFVFHSGTGLNDVYGDGKDGEIFDNNQEEVSDADVYTAQKLVFGDNVETTLASNMFYYRTGYKNNDYGYLWAQGVYAQENLNRFGETIFVDFDYFSQLSDGDSVHFYRIWTPQTYVLTLDVNEGKWSDGSTTAVKLSQIYDSAAIKVKTNVVKTGYDFKGWAFNEELVFDENGQALKGTSLFDENGCYIYPANVSLKAVWKSKMYAINVYFNGANAVKHGNEIVKDIFADENLTSEQKLAFSQIYSIEYATTFEKLYYSESLLSLSQILPSREGFAFDGFYLINGSRKVLITEKTNFNNNLATFVDDQNSAISLYAQWSFVASSINLSVSNTSLEPRDYTGVEQKIYLAEYFEDGYSSNNLTISTEGNLLSFLPNDALGVSLTTLTSSDTVELDAQNMAFTIIDAGDYSVSLRLEIYDSAPKFNLGLIWTRTFEFEIEINKAGLYIEETESQALLTERQVQNSKRLMQPFFEESLQEYDTLVDLAKLADTNLSDEKLAGLTNDEIYAFLMTKYYLLLKTNVGNEHITYRAWTYDNYQDYLSSNDNSQLVEKLKFFDFYDYAYTQNVKDVSLIYDIEENFILSGVKLNEIKAKSIAIYANNQIDANQEYNLRVYFEDTDSRIGNYEVESDEYGYYLSAGTVLILPQILNIENLGEKSSYYQVGSSKTIVSWQGERETINYAQKALYKVLDDIYLAATVYTSNIGHFENDTVYNYYDSLNYLYFDNILLTQRVENFGSVSYSDISSSFKLRMMDEFTILSTTGVAEISLSAKKLTKEDGAFIHEEIGQDIFALSVEYVVDGKISESETDFETLGMYWATTAAGSQELIYEIKEYQNGGRSIFVNSSVKSVTFLIQNLLIDDYTALYKWSEALSYALDGTMEKNNSLKFTFNFDLENNSFSAETSTGNAYSSSQDGITKIDYYAMFTDLVYVSYDYNMPEGEGYDDRSSVLKLGESTFEDLEIPNVSGFVLSKLIEGETGANLLDETERQTVFAEGEIFVGINEQNLHAPLNLLAKWQLPEEHKHTQLIEGTYSMPVLSYESIYYGQVIEFETSKIFEYTYYWQYRSSSEGEWTKPNVASNYSDRYYSPTLNLDGNGSVEESGYYKLVVEARLNSNYKAALDYEAKDTFVFEAEFALQFKRIKIVEVKTNEPFVAVYDAKSKTGNLGIVYTYKVFDAESQDYSLISSQASLPYAKTGNIVFVLSKDGNETLNMKDVGIYDIDIVFSDDYYDVSELPELNYQFEITPCELNLDNYVDEGKFNFEKTFNSTNSALSTKIYSNDELLELEFRREVGEDIGSYDVFLSGVKGESNGNYVFVFDEKTICQDGVLTENAATSVLGQFTIRAAQKLVISYITNDSTSEILAASYVETGYYLSAIEQTLQIMSNGSAFKTLTLRFYDEQNGKYLTDDCAAYIKPIVETLSFSFYDQGKHSIAYDATTYTYAVDSSTEMSEYFKSVEFDPNFKFEIQAKFIEFANVDIEKVYDGDAIANYSVEGEAITDIESYDGVYVKATFASVHAAEDIDVTLSLHKTNSSSENLSNYALETYLTTGKITKCAADLSFNITSKDLVYGGVNVSDLEVVLDSSNPFNLTSNGTDIEGLLASGYYTISLGLAQSSQTSSGYVKAGTHALQVEVEFNDFDVTVSAVSFQVGKLTLVKNLSVGYITILNTETLQTAYSETITISTGESFDIELFPIGVAMDEYNRPSAGAYSLALDENGSTSAIMFDGNVELTLASFENSFVVVATTRALYVEIVDTSVLSQTYNANDFSISSDGSTLTISSYGMVESAVSSLRFYEVENEVETDVTSISFSAFNISMASALSKNVGSVKLNLTATDATGTYTNIIFDQSYKFEIIAKTIDIASLSFDKEYDGSRNKTVEVSTSAGRVEGDELYINAIFESSFVKSQTAKLYLQGTDKANYVLSAASITASITKATANVTLTKTEYVYGELRNTSKPSHEVKTKDGAVVASTMYSIEFEISSDTTESTALRYLEVGEYSVSIKSQSSSYYNLSLTEESSIIISAYILDIVFNEAGGIKISADDDQAELANIEYSYTTVLSESVDLILTRQANENGKFNEMGDYKVISATTDNKNYEIGTITDEIGFIRIVKAKERVYLLLSEDDVVSESDMIGRKLSIEYNGYAYDTVEIEKINNNWALVISSSQDVTNSRKEFVINAYKRTAQSDGSSTYVYNKLNGASIENLNANAQFNDVAQAVNSGYVINVYDAVSSNFDVFFGKNGTTYSYEFEITKKNLYFKEGMIDNVTVALESTWQRPYMAIKFNNQNAEFEIENAVAILTGLTDSGLVAEEVVGLDVKFKDGANLAKYASAGYYQFEAVLTGEYAENYQLNCLFPNNTNEMAAKIEKADLTISANSKYYTYGQLISDSTDRVLLEDFFKYETEVVLNEEYISTYIDGKIIAQISAPTYSQSAALIAGEYSVLITSENTDFNLKYIINGTQSVDASGLRVTVNKKPVEIVQKESSLKEVFTKTYDGDATVESLDFDLSGLISGDDISIVGASYATSTIGENIQVAVEVFGEDIGNYNIKPYLYGTISPILVSIVFNYDSETISDVVRNGLVEISQLKYPFVSSGSLNANSSDINTSSTNNFPNMLYKEGKNFSHWSMIFSVENDIEKTFLENATSGMTTSYDEDLKIFEVKVGNNAKTVAFLSALMTDDVTNMFGFYYKNNSAPEIVFEPNFTTQQLILNIKIDKQDGGTVKVAYGETEKTLSENTTLQFDYGTKIILTATPNEHYYFSSYKVGSTTSTNSTYVIDSLTAGAEITANFVVQAVDVVYDLTGIDSSNITLPEGFDGNTYSSNYADLANLTLSDFALVREGYALARLEAVVDNSSQTFARDDFETTKIGTLLEGYNLPKITLILRPGFEADKIKVTLDYSYDAKTEEIFVDYQSKFVEAEGWISDPTREGYNFAGWFAKTGEQITNESVLDSTEAQTIFAKWSIRTYSLKLVVENADLVQQSGTTLVETDGAWVADAVEYASKIMFTLRPMQGYMISSTGWSEYFEIEIDDSGIAAVVLTMPAQDVEASLISEPENNSVVISGTRLQSLSYTIETETNNELNGSEFELEFKVFTGQSLEIEFSAQMGYVVKEIAIMDKNQNVLDFDSLGAEIILNEENNVKGIDFNSINQSIFIEINPIERLNKFSLLFDDVSRIESVDSSDGYSWLVEESLDYEILTGDEITFFIKYKLGYEFDACVSEGDVAQIVEETPNYLGWAHIKISNVISDVTIAISSKLASFNIVGKAVSYEMDGSEVSVEENVVYINGAIETKAQLGDELRFSYVMHKDYEFAGWSFDGKNSFSNEDNIVYTLANENLQYIEDNNQINIYGIFSKLQYRIEFGTYSYYTVGSEYNDESKLQEIYEEINGQYFDENNNQIFSATIYYGTNKNVKFKIPTGYSYVGFGYKNVSGEFVRLGHSSGSTLSEIEITIYSIDENIYDGMKIYFLVSPLKSNILVKNLINYEGIYEDDVHVGSTQLLGANEKYLINKYGYVEGTKVRFANNSFENGSVTSDKAFDIVAYSGDEIYLKIKVGKSGYKFERIISNNSNISIIQTEEAEDYVSYKISNIVGGLSDIQINILFKPQINKISLSFVHNSMITDGGAFEIKLSDDNAYKVFKSGSEYSSLIVSAFTDTEFDVVVLIRSGFFVNSNLEGVLEDLGEIIVEGSQAYEALSVTESGYTGMIRFKVKGYLGNYSINVHLDNLSYTVNLKDGQKVLARIKNVEFDKLLNLSESNSQNIEILDERFTYASGKLQTILALDKHTFEGYFTGQNGMGNRYIDSHGDAINYWNESGYVFDNLTSKYVLTENAYFDEATMQMTIDLYVYMSYLKTQINFKIVPNMDLIITAEDLISGVDYTNSWYYSALPMYIEVSYNTDIYFNAPEIDGYIFYKFIISQRNANGEWLTDVESVSNNVPWSTNELAQIVECNVQVVYFAKVDVSIIGGNATYTISQEGTPREMLQAGYVDTSKSFTITALPEDGYQFVNWKNLNTGSFVATETYSFARITSQVSLQLFVQGYATVLNFEDYDSTFGYVRSLKVLSKDGTTKSITLGVVSSGDFIKLVGETSKTDPARIVRVGDIVTFEVGMDYGFSAVWNREDVLLVGYTGTYYNFEMKISADFAGQTIKIIPTFTDDILSFYITEKFDQENPNAIDSNHVQMAGSVKFNQQKVNYFTVPKGQEILAEIELNDRYSLSKVVLINYSNSFNSGFLEDNKIVLSKDYLESNSIVGTVQIVVEYKRAMWEDDVVDETLDGNGTSQSKYVISSVDDLVLAMKLINSGAINSDGLAYKDASYVLRANIDLSEKFWSPIGTENNVFNGEFDFGKYKIAGIYNAYFYSPIYYSGLFGVLGKNANIHETNNDVWYIILIAAIFVALISLLTVLIIRNKRKKKRRQELSNK